MGFDFTKIGHGHLTPDRGANFTTASAAYVPVVNKSALDFAQAREMIEALDAQIDAMAIDAAAFKVETEDDAREATERAGRVKAFVVRMEERRKGIIAEPDSYVRKVNQAVKPRRDKLDGVERQYKQLIGDFAYRRELQRREIERKQREAVAALQKQIDADAKAMGVESVQVAPVAVQAKQGPTRSDSATASAVTVWNFEVTDAKAVPREYLTIDEAAIRAAIKAGIREVPGVRIFETVQTRIRRVG